MGTKSRRKSQVWSKPLDCFETKPVKGAFGRKKLTRVEFTYVDPKTGKESKKEMIIG